MRDAGRRLLCLAGVGLLAACGQGSAERGGAPEPRAAPYLDPDQPLERRVADLIGRMTLEEKVSQLQYESAAIPRLGIPAYNWWNEALHGVARAGRATVFPQAIAAALAGGRCRTTAGRARRVRGQRRRITARAGGSDGTVRGRAPALT